MANAAEAFELATEGQVCKYYSVFKALIVPSEAGMEFRSLGER